MISYKPLPILDPEVLDMCQNSSNIWKLGNTNQFKELYIDWIHSSNNFVVEGLDTFPLVALTDGVTGAFPNFHHAYQGRTVVFRGDYPYHRDTGVTVIENPNQIRSGDKLIISHPFAATGSKYEQLDRILDLCDRMNIPVFLDMAYFGISKLPTVVVDRNCIKMVAFSLSKTFATGKCKTGIVFYKKTEVKTPMQLLNEYNYVNHVSLNMHYELLKRYSADYMYDTYSEKQKFIATTLDVEVSGCVTLLVTNNIKYKGMSRDGTINRLGIAELLVQDLTEEKIKTCKLQVKP